MSEKMNWLAVSSWSALVAFQIGTAIYQGWKARSKRRRPRRTDFDRVVNGETRKGWRRALSMDAAVDAFYSPVVPRLADHIENQGEPTILAGSGVTFKVNYPLPNGRRILTLRRSSFIRAANMDLLKVVYDPLEWRPATWSCYLTSRTIAVGFESNSSSDMRLLLVDAFHRQRRDIALKTPEENMSALYFYFVPTPKRRLHVILGRYLPTEAELHVEFVDAKYDLWSDGGNGRALRALSWESVSFPMGDRLGRCTFYSGFEVAFVIYNKDNLNDANSHLCISIDYQRLWRVESLGRWLETFRNTESRKSVLEAIQSYAALSPPMDSLSIKIPQLRCFDKVVPCLIDGAALGGSGNHILQRWLSPPSLKRLAAEALFKTNADLKMSAAKRGIGFDISDGIVEEAVDDAETVYL